MQGTCRRTFNYGGNLKSKNPRKLIKISGEALGGGNSPFDQETIHRIAKEMKSAYDKGIEIAVVVGGGNVFRGAQGAHEGMDRGAADNVGMLATLQNGILLLDALERKCRISCRLMSAIPIAQVGEPYIVRRAVRHLEKALIVILVAGTGHGYCTTDYAAAVRGCEIDADLILKATNVDGIYTKDPRHNTDAEILRNVTYEQCIRDQLNVLDGEAFALCRTQKLPIRVFSMMQEGNIAKALTGVDIGTYVSFDGQPAPDC